MAVALDRLARYFEWVDAFRGRVVPAAAIAFTVRTSLLRIPPSMTPPLNALDLAPVLEMLKHDSLIHRCVGLSWSWSACDPWR